jgi:acyl carrier protein
MTSPQMNRDQIQFELTTVFRDVFDDPSLVLRDDLTASNVEGWDSLSHINMIVAVERTFRVKFALADISRLKDVGELISLIEQKGRQA